MDVTQKPTKSHLGNAIAPVKGRHDGALDTLINASSFGKECTGNTKASALNVGCECCQKACKDYAVAGLGKDVHEVVQGTGSCPRACGMGSHTQEIVADFLWTHLKAAWVN